jgi:hypothetical protein
MIKSEEERYGDSVLRIVRNGEGYRGIVIRNGRQGPVLEDDDRTRLIARLRNEAGRLHPNYVGFEAAVGRFRTFFPDGFSDARYLSMEREYKLAARANLVGGASLEAILAETEPDLAAVRKAFQTNMLSPFEAARVSDVLRSASGAGFVKAAAVFASGDFERGMAGMVNCVAPHGRPSWPIMTYLPFFWRPDQHMFLKPEKTVDFAARVGDPFADDYSPDLHTGVYLSLLGLAERTEAEIRNLNPADRIDVQSFIWVVGDYGESELPEGEDSSD